MHSLILPVLSTSHLPSPMSLVPPNQKLFPCLWSLDLDFDQSVGGAVNQWNGVGGGEKSGNPPDPQTAFIQWVFLNSTSQFTTHPEVQSILESLKDCGVQFEFIFLYLMSVYSSVFQVGQVQYHFLLATLQKFGSFGILFHSLYP